MKPITEQEKTKLIYDCKKSIAFLTEEIAINHRLGLPVSDYESMLIRQQIALASLTAVPVGKVNRGEVSDDNEYPHAKVECVHPHADWNNFKDGFALYTAPPVPVMKLPEKKDSEHVYHGAIGAFNAGKSAGYNECIADIEQLNGVGSDE